MHLGRIREHCASVLGQMLLYGNGGGERGPQQGESFLDEYVQVHGVVRHCCAATESEDALHQVSGTYAGSAHLVEILLHHAGRWHASYSQFSVAEDCLQHVVEIVSNAPG